MSVCLLTNQVLLFVALKLMISANCCTQFSEVCVQVLFNLILKYNLSQKCYTVSENDPKL